VGEQGNGILLWEGDQGHGINGHDASLLKFLA
jgi:hypothetical protein